MALRFSVPVFAFCNRFKYVLAISRQVTQLFLLDPFRRAVALANWAARGVAGIRCLPWDLVQELFHAQLKSKPRCDPDRFVAHMVCVVAQSLVGAAT